MKNFSFSNFDSRVLLAPMEAVNCTAFRLICRKYGAGITYSQMYDADVFLEASEKLLIEHYLDFHKEEDALAVQFAANKGEKLALSFLKTEQFTSQHRFYDINFGCPLSSQTSKKACSYFLSSPQQLPKYLSDALSSTNYPVSAKIRLGYDAKRINYLEVGKILEDHGICAVTLHPRAKKDRYTTQVDINHITKLKEHLNIPVIGNGDVTLPGHAKSMFERTKCDAVMIARAAMGNPYIFKRINALLSNGKNIDDVSKLPLFLEFLDIYRKKQKRYSFSEICDHAKWFCKSDAKATLLKKGIENSKDEEALVVFLKKHWS